ncbi:hypothetical protein [Ekhidna sp.]
MIKNKDFAPKIIKKGSFFKSTEVEDFKNVLTQMNEWIDENKPEVINVETVVLPNIHDPEEEGSEDTMLGSDGQNSSMWFQFIRLWYK